MYSSQPKSSYQIQLQNIRLATLSTQIIWWTQYLKDSRYGTWPGRSPWFLFTSINKYLASSKWQAQHQKEYVYRKIWTCFLWVLPEFTPDTLMHALSPLMMSFLCSTSHQKKRLIICPTKQNISKHLFEMKSLAQENKHGMEKFKWGFHHTISAHLPPGKQAGWRPASLGFRSSEHTQWCPKDSRENFPRTQKQS